MSTAIATMLLAGLSGIAGQAALVFDDVSDRNELNRQARFAMQQMVNAVSGTHRLMLPMVDLPATALLENIREQTQPPSAPPAGSTLGTAVLAVALPVTFDLDANSMPDADNDGDGRIDEDLPADTTNDSKPGIRDIDDDGNGIKDFWLSPVADDDESSDFAQNEDAINGIDNDGDGNLDEDPGADNNADGCPGLCGVDDDADSNTDEGAIEDDDEDGSSDEDWYDALVFYMNNGNLYQRTPVPWDEDGDLDIDGSDTVESVIAENVSRFRVERLPPKGNRPLILDITLELTSPTTGQVVSLHNRIRAGSAR